MSWPDDGEPRFVAQETAPLRQAKRGPMLVLDRAYAHRLIGEYKASARGHRKATEMVAALNAADDLEAAAA